LSWLTTIVIIKKALELHHDFPWARIAEMWPAQVNAATQAYTLIENQPFFGYSGDLGDVKSTNYKDLAYVRKELLTKMDGAGSLGGYGGWKSAPRNKTIIATMIADYISVKEDPPTGPMDAVPIGLAQGLISAAHSSNRITMQIE
jgi:hypothetical protein